MPGFKWDFVYVCLSVRPSVRQLNVAISGKGTPDNIQENDIKHKAKLEPKRIKKQIQKRDQKDKKKSYENWFQI